MTPERLKPTIQKGMSHPSPLTKDGKKPTPVNKRDDFDIGNELIGYGLQGVRVTEDELRDLVAELGLDGDEAGDLVKGLTSLNLDEESSPNKHTEPQNKNGESRLKALETQEKLADAVSDTVTLEQGKTPTSESGLDTSTGTREAPSKDSIEELTLSTQKA
jgi:hypothetical protein